MVTTAPGIPERPIIIFADGTRGRIVALRRIPLGVTGEEMMMVTMEPTEPSVRQLGLTKQNFDINRYITREYPTTFMLPAVGGIYVPTIVMLCDFYGNETEWSQQFPAVQKVRGLQRENDDLKKHVKRLRRQLHDYFRSEELMAEKISSLVNKISKRKNEEETSEQREETNYFNQ